jgi:hypothetical protein
MRRSLAVALLWSVIPVTVAAQSPPPSRVFSTGFWKADSLLSNGSPFVQASATHAVRADGAIVAFGGGLPAPPLPPGVTYVEVASHALHTVARRSDGSIVAWGDNMFGALNVPALPPGVTYVALAEGSEAWHSAALRSDGVLVAWGNNSHGQCNVSGSAGPFSSLVVGSRNTGAIRNGSLSIWGANQAQLIRYVPTSGTFVDYAIGSDFPLALRSDQTVVSWGYWYVLGQPWTRPPTSPPGTHVVDLAAGYDLGAFLYSNGQILVSQAVPGGISPGDAGPSPATNGYLDVQCGRRHVVARRVGGGLAAWGALLPSGQPLDVPCIPSGTDVVDVAATAYGPALYALRDDGGISAFGATLAGQPAPPAGTNWRAIACGGRHAVLLASDGTAHAFGSNQYGQCTVPALPPGVTYTKVGAGLHHTLLLRSDGTLAAFGYAFDGQCNVPALPPGVSYVEADGGLQFSLARRSDGEVVLFGSPVVPPPPPLPPGLGYTAISAAATFYAARRSDGQVLLANFAGTLPTPTAGSYFVELAAARAGNFLLLRGSDGRVYGMGGSSQGQLSFPPIPPAGSSYVSIAASESTSLFGLSRPSTYVRAGVGCAGTLAAGRLVPEDTPRIARPLTVQLERLPQDVAFLVTGFTTVGSPALDLSAFGATGCSWYPSLDLVDPVLGANGYGRTSLALPDDPTLVGVMLWQQALVLDNANVFGFVASDAARLQIGAR